jgi:hypothetical protein
MKIINLRLTPEVLEVEGDCDRAFQLGSKGTITKAL